MRCACSWASVAAAPCTLHQHSRLGLLNPNMLMPLPRCSFLRALNDSRANGARSTLDTLAASCRKLAHLQDVHSVAPHGIVALPDGMRVTEGTLWRGEAGGSSKRVAMIVTPLHACLQTIPSAPRPELPCAAPCCRARIQTGDGFSTCACRTFCCMVSEAGARPG